MNDHGDLKGTHQLDMVDKRNEWSDIQTKKEEGKMDIESKEKARVLN